MFRIDSFQPSYFVLKKVLNLGPVKVLSGIRVRAKVRSGVERMFKVSGCNVLIKLRNIWLSCSDSQPCKVNSVGTGEIAVTSF